MSDVYELTEVSKKVFKERNDYFILALQGAVRSGKTYISNIIFLDKLENKSGNVLISGFSSDTAKKNIIPDLEDLLGCEFKNHNSAKGEYYSIPLKEFKNIKIYVKGAGKAGDEKKIQGMTLLAWYADETVTYNKEFFDMALTRLSMRNSFAIFTMNPDSPSHWLKAWLEKDDFAPGYLKNYHFMMPDNPSLSKKYIENAKINFSGHFYKRYILGEWAIGQGLVFPVDDLIIEKEEILNEMFKNMNPFLYTVKCGIDLGTVHPTAFISLYEYQDKFYILDEYYEPNKSPTELVKDFTTFDKSHRFDEIVYDPAAKWFAQQMQEDTDYSLTKAKKNVEEGIMFVAMLIKQKKLIISDKCVNTIKEFNSYSYDSKKNNEVIKLNDDAMDALRYVLMSSKQNWETKY